MASKRFLVVDGPLSVRKEPNGMWVSQLTTGQEVEVDADSRRDTGGFVCGGSIISAGRRRKRSTAAEC
jgi:hypothetical protein